MKRAARLLPWALGGIILGGVASRNSVRRLLEDLMCAIGDMHDFGTIDHAGRNRQSKERAKA